MDVWDALSSDCPNRDAWPEEKVLAYLQEQARGHFDPQGVEAFLEILQQLGGSPTLHPRNGESTTN